MTIKVIGHQWYWSYEYPDNGEIGFDSFMVPDDKLKEGQPRLSGGGQSAGAAGGNRRADPADVGPT